MKNDGHTNGWDEEEIRDNITKCHIGKVGNLKSALNVSGIM
jgi:hypothetical protein